MKIHNILSTKDQIVHRIGPAQTVQEAVDLLVQQNIGALLVTDGDAIAGIITERDILRLCARNASGLSATLVRDIMSTDLIICRNDDDVEEAMATMTNKHIRHLPILDGLKISGMISIGDIVKSMLQSYEHEIKYLRDYITGERLG